MGREGRRVWRGQSVLRKLLFLADTGLYLK